MSVIWGHSSAAWAWGCNCAGGCGNVWEEGMNGMKNLVPLIIGWLFFGMPLQAASFDCGKAANDEVWRVA